MLRALTDRAREIQLWRGLCRDERLLSNIPTSPLHSYIRPIKELSGPVKMKTPPLLERFLQHSFQVLGSGWRDASEGASRNAVPQGGLLRTWFSDFAYRQCGHVLARRAREHLSRDYRRLDWQADIKGGYRWSAERWYRFIPVGTVPGVDVKVPWEIARGHHLPLLAYGYELAKSEPRDRPETSAAYLNEFQNQVLDFISANPRGFGVNWACTMDVGIRVANWLLAFDLFNSFGAEFDKGFLEIFGASVLAHALHCARNLEYSRSLTSNHYLGDIAGLLFSSAYLPASPLVDCLLALSLQELTSEVFKQFHQDGSNFEASTCYHRLSLEMALFCTALSCSLDRLRREKLCEYQAELLRTRPRLRPSKQRRFRPEDPAMFPPEYFERLSRGIRFLRDCSGASARIVQVGDNDSGRFLKLSPAAHEDGAELSEVEQVSLDGTQLAAGGRECLQGIERGAAGVSLSILVESFIRPSPGEEDINFSSEESGFKLTKYSDFGLYFYRSSQVFLAMRCGDLGQNGQGGHAHNDNLSLAFSIRGTELVVDPGTYLYTADPAERNYFRSTASHSTLFLEGKEQNDILPGRQGLFKLADRARAEVVECGDDYFFGRHYGFGSPHERKLRLYQNRIEGEDYCAAPGQKHVQWILHPRAQVDAVGEGYVTVRAKEDGPIKFSAASGSFRVIPWQYSPSFGRKFDCRKIILSDAGPEFKWQISWE